MPILRVDRGLGLDVPDDFEADGWTVHMVLDQAGRRFGMELLDLCMDHVPGESWRLSGRAVVTVNGQDVRQAEGLSTPVGLKDVVDVTPARARLPS